MNLHIQVSPGELLDKISILEIKLRRMSDVAKRSNVRVELNILEAARDQEITPSEELSRLIERLSAINLKLWDIEDAIRDCERAADFGDAFVSLARSVYRSNDERAEIKRAINQLLGSLIVEEKSYAAY